VTDTLEPASPDASGDPGGSASAPRKRAGGLSSMLLADLKAMAGGLGIRGAGSMKKAQLVDAIKAAQTGANGRTAGGGAGPADDSRQAGGSGAPTAPPAEVETPATGRVGSEAGPRDDRDDRDERRETPQDDREERSSSRQRGNRQQASAEQGQSRQSASRQNQKDQGQKDQGQKDQGQKDQGQQKEQGQRDQGQRDQRQRDQGQQRDQAPQGQQRDGQGGDTDQRDQNDDGQGSRRSRRRRGRERGTRPQQTGQRGEPDTTILDDDVLTPAAGILDVLDNYAFVRTSGYLAGADDVYVSLSMVRKYGLRRGDAIVGQVRQPRDGERREKFNPMVRIDSVNGADPEAAKNRVDFAKLTPLYPSERLRLETEPTNLIGRVIDIAAPIGKGQRGLIVSPAKAGKTMIMQSIATSITTNNPECHLMVVLVDERPEEVTDFERSTKGEVISSTFDRPASDHTTVAELAIERAKRLVELGHDVVVLLDGITRLGRAYNLSAPASGRILSGGVDSAALYPPKRFFGAARNIENGGSLTILATALIESGSKMDEVIFEEFKGTGNMEIRLRRDFADKRLFPAIDAVQSGTRREELLMSKEELQIVWKLRRVLSGLDGQQALELLLERLRKTQTNIEFLMQVQKTTPGAISGED
jgi:transcription termination factor Rho